MNMTVEFCGIKMKSPIIAASGTFGYGIEYKDYMDLNQVGAISVKGLGLTPWTGNKGGPHCGNCIRCFELHRFGKPWGRKVLILLFTEAEVV